MDDSAPDAHNPTVATRPAWRAFRAGCHPISTLTDTFTYIMPSPELQDYVAFHYILQVADHPFDEVLCALLGQIQVGIGGAAEYVIDGRAVHAPRGSVIAPTDRAIRLRAPAGFAAVGSALTPAGWSALLERQNARGNTIDDLAAMGFGPPFDPGGEVSAEPLVPCLDQWLRGCLADRPIDPRVRTIDAWIVETNGEDVEGLATSLSMSRRSLERLTMRTHGASPKRLSAKYRSLKIAGELAVGLVENWRDAAAARGLADQSHFIREFRRYVGVTPGKFMSDQTSFVRQLIQGQWRPGRAMSVTIWS